MCVSPSEWASARWAMSLSCHAAAMREHICLQDTKTDGWMHFLLFSFPPSLSLSFSPSLVPVFLFPVGRLVWEEKDLEAETRAEGTEGRHLYACWQERERWSRKIKEVPDVQKKDEQKKTRKEKRSGAKIFALSSPYVWHLYLFVRVSFLFFFLLKRFR